MIAAKCPHCGTAFGSITHPRCYRTTSASFGASIAINVVIFACPTQTCQAVLGISPDPFSLAADAADQTAKKLGRR
jgi:hypothetical protein